eukprot:2364055-Rhodomonas_salina.1
MQPNQRCRELVPNHCECEMEENGCWKEAGDGGQKGWGVQGLGWRGRGVLLKSPCGQEGEGKKEKIGC